MSSFTDKCFEFFKTRNLYKVLGIETNAVDSEVKKAYYRMSLKVHPDRASENVRHLATQKFQILGRVYSILSDKDKRIVYDESGSIDEESDVQSDKDWEYFWRLHFKKITAEDIEKFKLEYKGSDEEIEDLKEHYRNFKGDMDKIMEFQICDMEDESRLREILINAIKQGEIKDYPAFSNEKSSKRGKREKRFMKEASEAEEARKELGLDKPTEANSLEVMIMKRQETRQKQQDDFLANLEAKYCGKNAKKAKIKNSEASKANSPARPKKSSMHLKK